MDRDGHTVGGLTGSDHSGLTSTCMPFSRWTVWATSPLLQGLVVPGTQYVACTHRCLHHAPHNTHGHNTEQAPGTQALGVYGTQSGQWPIIVMMVPGKRVENRMR